jgi:hypothetical protein
VPAAKHHPCVVLMPRRFQDGSSRLAGWYEAPAAPAVATTGRVGWVPRGVLGPAVPDPFAERPWVGPEPIGLSHVIDLPVEPRVPRPQVTSPRVVEDGTGLYKGVESRLLPYMDIVEDGTGLQRPLAAAGGSIPKAGLSVARTPRVTTRGGQRGDGADEIGGLAEDVPKNTVEMALNGVKWR